MQLIVKQKVVFKQAIMYGAKEQGQKAEQAARNMGRSGFLGQKGPY